VGLDVRALRYRIADVVGVVVRAARQIHALLNAVPLDVVETAGELHAVVEETVLGADLVALHLVGPIGEWRRLPDELLRGLAAGARRYRRIGTANAEALGVGGIELVVAIDVVLDAQPRRERLRALAPRVAKGRARRKGRVSEAVEVKPGI